ncbi:Sialic acid TRAP transporter permease protein SiaT [Rhodobacteraceae bacterium THAF1]|uniref:TRAP transporter large permease n=1 Tax=Palleronia sp. THAF1 TaxID=2587842 RepID=UPI000F3DE685|nr:TRAP transporter large permease [Palleronia sp. THAF1]QFU08773.1 Sialic acid TRAP transporter permease protein SiaT [Palleronia sp. THAF1]VDC31219.1 Sialic acid TRAP transporter permease protein SiaT [Rhodobacteraceae bacterium THAF1]
MSDIMIGLLGLGGLLVLIAANVHVGIALILVSYLGLWALVGEAASWGMLQVVPFTFISNWTLSSVPMFVLMGYVCYHANLTRGLFDSASLWLARLPGGLAIASVFGCSGFAAVTGSSVATAAAMGKVAVPEMLRHGYNPGLATGTVAAAGTVGALIPPSILLIVFGVIAQTSITDLFLGGIGAGLVTALAYILVIWVRVSLKPALAPRVTERIPMRRKIGALKQTLPIILLIVGVLGGLFAGLFTATQAGAVGALLSFVVAGLQRALNWQVIRSALVETLVTCGSLFIITIGASMLTRFLTLSGIGWVISDAVTALDAGPILLLAGIAVVYMILGMFLEPIGAMLITLPIFLPLTQDAGIDPIWFGVFVAKLLEIGMITPPVGMNVFVLSSTVGKAAPSDVVFKGVLWFFVIDILLLALLVAVPSIITFLPSLG